MDKSKTVNYTSTSNTLIICETDLINERGIVSLAQEKSLESSFEWKNNHQDDYRIYLEAILNYNGAYNLTFDDRDNKWHFLVNKSNI